MRARPLELAIEPAADLRRSLDDPAGYLIGSWHLDRRIGDLSARHYGRLRGQAVFTADEVAGAGALVCEEQGVLVWPGHRDVAWRRTRYRPSGPGRLLACFEDGRPFYLLDLRSGSCAVEHDCAPDRYRGEIAVRSPASWSSRWRIEGPRKDLVIVTRYRRREGEASA